MNETKYVSDIKRTKCHTRTHTCTQAPNFVCVMKTRRNVNFGLLLSRIKQCYYDYSFSGKVCYQSTAATVLPLWMPFLYLNVEQFVNRQYLKQHIHHLYAKWILLMENVRDIECRQEYHLHFMCILRLNAWDYWKTNNAKCLCNATRCIETHWRIYSTTAERIIARISLFVQYHMQLHQIKMRASGFLQRFREVSIFITLTGKTIRTCIVCNIGTEDLLRNS